MMDNLHGMLRALSSEQGVKSCDGEKQSPHHLDVFREFLSRLERVQRQPTQRPRVKPARKAARMGKR